jgi:hypothetical protein
MLCAFLLSPPRSGSTLLSALLDLHSEIRVSAEPWMLLSLYSMYREANQGALYGSESLSRGFTEFLIEEDFKRAARSFAESAYADKLRESDKRIFVDKTPRYYHILQFVEELFPEAKFIVLSRNPFDIAASILTSWGVSSGELTGRYISPFTFDLDFAIRRLNLFKANQPNVLHIRYEDLVRNPENTLKKVQEFLGATSEADLEYGKSRYYGESQTHAMGDKKIINHLRPHQGSVSSWKDRLDSGTVNALAQSFTVQELDDFGYSDVVTELRGQGVTFGSEETVRDRDRKLLAIATDFNNYVGLDLASVEQVLKSENESIEMSPESIGQFTRRMGLKVQHTQLNRNELSNLINKTLEQLAIYSGERNYLRERHRELEFLNGSLFATLIIWSDCFLALYEKFVGDSGELAAKRDANTLQSSSEELRIQSLAPVGGQVSYFLDRHFEQCRRDLEDCREDLEQCRKDLDRDRTDLEQCRRDLDRSRTDLEQCRRDLDRSRTDLEQCRRDLEDCRKDLEAARSIRGVSSFLVFEMPKRLATKLFARFHNRSK